MKVNTVSGEVDIEDLGITLVHEHMTIRSDEVFNQFPHLYNVEKELETAIKDVKSVQQYGVKTICDPTVLGLGRDAPFLKQVADATDINILMATGIYTYNEIPFHFKNQSIDYMADLFCKDIECGVQNTNIKASFLKCSADEAGITPDIEKVTRAVARASIRTNKPIMTHSKPSKKNGLEQVKILLEEGVHPQNILIGHTGDTDNLEYIKDLLEYGVFIGMDRYGLEKFATTDVRNSTLIQLLEMGYENQIFLSQDYCCNTDWYTEKVKKEQSPKWKMDYLFTDVIPQLQKEGISNEIITILLNENIKKWLEEGR